MNNIDLNALRDRVYKNAVAHGWHEEERNREHWMCMVITELAEAVQADRKGHRANKEKFEEWENDFFPGKGAENLTFDIYFEEYIKDRVEDELSDAIIRLLDYAGLRDFDMSLYDWHREIIEERIERYKNETFSESIFFIIGRVLKEYPKQSLIEIIALSRAIGIPDIFYYVEQKMKYNESRPYKHGKKY